MSSRAAFDPGLPRRVPWHWLVALALLLPPASGRAQGLGEAPALGAGARDLRQIYRLPPLRDQEGEIARQLAGLQVGVRAKALGLTAASATAAWSAADATLGAARTRIATTLPADARVFNGSRASQLNALIADPAVHAIRVTAAELRVDAPITIRRSGLRLDLGETALRPDEPMPRFLMRIVGASGVTVAGGTYGSGAWAVLVDGGRDVALVDGRYAGLREGGIVLTDTRAAVVARSRFSGIGGAPVLLHGTTETAAVLDNEIVDNRGPSNWHAGIVVTDRRGAVAEDPASLLESDRYWARPQRIAEQRIAPRRNVIARNRIARNAASGLYIDGAIETVAFDNLIEGNSKEGVCLDYGATANVLAMNVIRLNGKRWGKSEAELALDFVAGMGRLPDGSPPAKTPGISLDNALWNIVYANQVDRNHGGGVKMVRSAFFNLVGLNTVTDNNEGASARFHFFGIELGSAKADAPAADLDFAPSRGNIVFGNAVRGSHYAGIFFGVGSSGNEVFDNGIFGATAWALEQAEPQPNASLNNLTNLPSRNIDAGLDPKLRELTKAR